MGAELERDKFGLLSSVSDMVDGMIDRILGGECGFVSFNSQLPLLASDLADG